MGIGGAGVPLAWDPGLAGVGSVRSAYVRLERTGKEGATGV